MIKIEIDEPPTVTLCECCGGQTTRLTRFVYRDGDAFAIYYAAFSDNHPDREMKIAIGLGEWGDGSTPEARTAFALVMRAADEQYEVMVVDAEKSPWRNARVIGRMLDREEALQHPHLEDAFHITDHMVEEDPQVRAYFEGGPSSAAETD